MLATIKKIKYHNELTNWAVIQFIDEEGATFIGVGDMGPQYPGYCLRLKGKWEPNNRGGADQFKVSNFEVLPPKSEEGIYLFLASGLFKGMTKSIARKLVDEYGSKTLSLLDTDINILSTIPGVGAKTFIKIRDSYSQTKPQQEKVFTLINQYGFTFTEALLIVKVHPERTLKMLETSPYAMYRKLHKIPFVRFDQVMMAGGYPPADKQRIREVILHNMKNSFKFGHTVSSYGQVLNDATAYLKQDPYLVDTELNWLILKRRLWCVKSNGEWVLQPMWIYAAEKEIATRLSLIEQTPAEKELFFDPNDERLDKLKSHQRRAVVAPFKHKVSIVTGRPGAGKTTLLRTMLDLIESQNVSVLAVSPTGKAAQRLREVTGRDCSTIHRALGATYAADEYVYNDLNPLEVDVVVVDETSMLDTIMTKALLRAIPYTSRIILIGDVEQLPSVSAGAVYRDLIDSQRFAVYWLTEVLRITKDDGSLPTPLIVSGQIREGYFNSPPNDEEWAYFPTKNDADTRGMITKTVNDLIAKGVGYNDVQVFAPMNNDEMGVDGLNKLVKRCFYPDGSDHIEVNDKVMQRENNYDLGVFNGDIGVVKEIYDNEKTAGADDPVMMMEMAGSEVEYTKRDLYNVNLAYTITGHKSQGSEYPYVIIVIPDHHLSLMDRYWLYTLVTRCQKKAYMIGNPGVIAQTVKSARSHQRRTLLRDQLARFIPQSNVVVK